MSAGRLLKLIIFLWFANLLWGFIPCFLGEHCGSASVLVLMVLVASVLFVSWGYLVAIIYKGIKNKKNETTDRIKSGAWITSLVIAGALVGAISHVSDWGQIVLLGVFLGIPFIMLIRLHLKFILSDIKMPIEIKSWMVWAFFITLGGIVYLLGAIAALLPVLLVDLMWVIQRIKQQKDILSYVESACVLLPYCIISYFVFS